MIYCIKCGAQLSDDADYCQKCGAKIDYIIENNNRNQLNGSSKQDRIEAAKELGDMYEYFSGKENVYKEYDYLTSYIPSNRKKKHNIISAWLPISITLGIFVIILSVLIKNDQSGTEPVMLIFLAYLLSIISAIGLIIVVVSSIIYNTKYNEACDRYSDISKELYDYYVAYGYCPVGIEFSNPRIIYEIANIVRQGRADTTKEAINILFTDAHRTRMEMTAQQTMINTAMAARGACTSAFFCAASFFLK